jgi:hypothetical protein
MKKIMIITSLLILNLTTLAFEDPLVDLLKKLEEFTKKYPQEKVYLHLDKPYYAIGDDIWFNAYTINAKTNEPTNISNVLYVELINEKDSVTKHLKLHMKGGIAWGDFKLTDDLIEGNYRIRAYTQWMRNTRPNFFFDKTIKVGNYFTNSVFTNTSVQQSSDAIIHTIEFKNKDNAPFANCEVNYIILLANNRKGAGKAITNAYGVVKISTPNQNGSIIATITLPDKKKISKTITIKSTEADVQFFAESGNLIEGLPGKIAVKAINKNGLGENVKLTVYDSEKIEILDFETTYLGMGSFILTPMEGKSYQVKVKFENGSEQFYNLPKVEKSGYALNVTNTDSTKMTIKVMLSADLLHKGDLNLVMQHNGKLYFNNKVSTDKQLATITIPKSEVPSGLVQITLFNPNNIPVAERLAFINNPTDKIDLTVKNLKSIYAKKENLKIEILASNNAKPTQGSFSVAVTNTAIVNPDIANENNILTNLLLTSDLVGYVEKPNYYFIKNDVETRLALDNLLLTQGWRKINWEEIKSNQDVNYTYPAEKSLKISGVVTTNNKKFIANGKIALLSSTKGMFASTTTTDENGRFIFDEMSFGDSLKFVVQASAKEDKKNVKIKLDKFEDQEIGLNKNIGDIDINVNTSLNNYLQGSEQFFEEQYKKGFLTRTNLLKSVSITQKRTKREDSAAVYSANYNGRGNANYIITANDLQNSYSLAQYITQGRIMGVADSSGYAWNTRIGPIGNPPEFGQPPAVPKLAVVIDGMMLENFSLEEIQVKEVESVEVLISPGYTAAYGSNGNYGVLVISMKRGSSRKMADITSPGLVIYQPKGYDVPRQFYSPKYDAKPDNNPDLRTTVYWNPQFVTDATGKGAISFYNTDQSGNYRVVIEGIDAEGNLARKVFTYLVN